jgi:hypothetical protein
LHEPERYCANHELTGDERASCQRRAIANPELLYASAILDPHRPGCDTRASAKAHSPARDRSDERDRPAIWERH